MKTNILWILFIFNISLFSCKKEVASIKPEFKSITASVYASGTVKSLKQYNIYAGSTGLIKSISVNEGSLVKKGDVILKINNMAAILQADNAALAVKFNDYDLNMDKVTQIKKDIEIASRKLKLDSMMMSRQNNLWEQGIGTKNDQEQKELNYFNTKANLDNLRLKLKDILRQLKYASSQSKKNLEIIKSQVNEYTIKSEIDGKIYSLTKEVGEMVGPTTQFGVIGDDKNYMIELQLDEYDITSIKIGQAVIVKMDSHHDSVFEAKVDRINPLMNEKTRTFTVEAVFVTKPDILYPNLSVEANIVLNKKDKTLTIPSQYVFENHYVMLKDGTKKKIKIGLRDYQLTEVLEGIDSGTEIIIPQ